MVGPCCLGSSCALLKSSQGCGRAIRPGCAVSGRDNRDSTGADYRGNRSDSGNLYDSRGPNSREFGCCSCSPSGACEESGSGPSLFTELARLMFVRAPVDEAPPAEGRARFGCLQYLFAIPAATYEAPNHRVETSLWHLLLWCTRHMCAQ